MLPSFKTPNNSKKWYIISIKLSFKFNCFYKKINY